MMDFYGLIKDFRNVGNFQTDDQQKTVSDLIAIVKLGKLVVLSGIVGAGKTVILRQLREKLEKDRDVLVAKPASAENEKINIRTLIMALFYELSGDKKVKIPIQSEDRERKLREMIRKQKKTPVLLIDDAHRLKHTTLVNLKNLMEILQDDGSAISIVLSGHPKLKNDLLNPAMEEIGARAIYIELDIFSSNKKNYIKWVIEQSTKSKTKYSDIITDDAIDLLSNKLITPLQVELYLELAVKEGYKIGEKPISSDFMSTIMTQQIEGLEARLSRSGYKVRPLARLLNIKTSEINALLRGQLNPKRTQELKEQMLLLGIPV